MVLRQGRDGGGHVCVLEGHIAQVDVLTLSVLVKVGGGRGINYQRPNEGWTPGIER